MHAVGISLCGFRISHDQYFPVDFIKPGLAGLERQSLPACAAPALKKTQPENLNKSHVGFFSFLR